MTSRDLTPRPSVDDADNRDDRVSLPPECEASFPILPPTDSEGEAANSSATGSQAAIELKPTLSSESNSSLPQSQHRRSAEQLQQSIASPQPPTDYASAIAYLYQQINYERSSSLKYGPDHFRLDRMHRLAELLGNPHLKYPIVHVAGTKGKGTVCHLLADCLNASGFRTGLYTSPHLLELEERFQVGGRTPSPDEMVELVEYVKAAATQLEAEGHGQPTFFELTTALGFLHFARRRVDAVVLEVGLGGRLDSTNICQPVACVITSIGLDHQKQLGNSIASIASEKAGIIKQGVPVVCSARHPDARKVIESRAAELEAPLFLLDRDFSVAWESLESRSGLSRIEQPLAVQNSKHSSANFPATLANQHLQSAWVTFSEPNEDPRSGESTKPRETRWRTRLLGKHQADNIAATVATIRLLNRIGWSLADEPCGAAIAAAQPAGRLQIVGMQPLRVIDTAHNPESIAAGLVALDEHFPTKELTVVFATSKDKDYLGMLKAIIPCAKHLILTSYKNNPRRLSLARLETATQECHRVLTQTKTGSSTDRAEEQYFPRIYTAANPAAAWQTALACTNPNSGAIYATGSFFLAAELLGLEATSTRAPKPA